MKNIIKNTITKQLKDILIKIRKELEIGDYNSFHKTNLVSEIDNVVNSDISDIDKMLNVYLSIMIAFFENNLSQNYESTLHNNFLKYLKSQNLSYEFLIIKISKLIIIKIGTFYFNNQSEILTSIINILESKSISKNNYINLKNNLIKLENFLIKKIEPSVLYNMQKTYLNLIIYNLNKFINDNYGEDETSSFNKIYNEITKSYKRKIHLLNPNNMELSDKIRYYIEFSYELFEDNFNILEVEEIENYNILFNQLLKFLIDNISISKNKVNLEILQKYLNFKVEKDEVEFITNIHQEEYNELVELIIEKFNNNHDYEIQRNTFPTNLKFKNLDYQEYSQTDANNFKKIIDELKSSIIIILLNLYEMNRLDYILEIELHINSKFPMISDSDTAIFKDKNKLEHPKIRETIFLEKVKKCINGKYKKLIVNTNDDIVVHNIRYLIYLNSIILSNNQLKYYDEFDNLILQNIDENGHYVNINNEEEDFKGDFFSVVLNKLLYMS